MIILRQKGYSLIPFKNTFQHAYRSGKNLMQGNFKTAGKEALKSTGNLLAGTGKLAVGATALGTAGVLGVSHSINSAYNDDYERYKYHNKPYLENE